MKPHPIQDISGKSSGYLATLDGWRAIAILLVMVAHDRLHRVGPLSTEWFKAYGAGAGVGLFFGLSGFLICSRLLQEERLRGRIDLKRFYIRRFFRIQPASLVYLGTVCALMLTGVFVRHYDDLFSSLFFVRNYIHRESWYTAHFWSLAIEEHFYLLLPGFLALCSRYRAAVLGGLAVATEACRLWFVGTTIHNYQSDLEGGTIILCSCLAVLFARPDFQLWCRRWLRPWFTAAIAVAVWTRVAVHHSRFDHPACMLTFPLLIISTVASPSSLLGWALEWKGLKFIGLISYSLYLWQQMFFVTDMAVPRPNWAALAWVQATAWRYLAIFGLAIASYYAIERPMMRLGHRLAKPATPGREDL